MEKSVLRALQACPLFAGLSAKEVESTINMVEYHLVKYGKKELYAKEGYPVENVDIVISGGMSGRTESSSGNRSPYYLIMHDTKGTAIAIYLRPKNTDELHQTGF